MEVPVSNVYLTGICLAEMEEVDGCYDTEVSVGSKVGSVEKNNQLKLYYSWVLIEIKISR